MNKIRVRNLNKSYGKKLVLKDFSADIYKGRFNIIIGPSGSGKTTFLRILMDLEDYTSGEIRGLNNLNIAPVFQENRLLENYSVYKNIELVKDNISREEVERLLEALGLYKVLDKKVSELSGGMKRRVAILRALVRDVDVYIFDEPFKELDSKNYYILLDFIKMKLDGKTVIFTSHRLEEINYFDANKIIIE